jgi:hypothetical protein
LSARARHAERRLARRGREPPAGPPDLLHGLRPGAPQLDHLGPVHQALTAEWHQVRLRRAPVGQRRGPLPRAAQVEQLMACLDHGAVDDPDHDRRQLGGLDGDHGLVQRRHALGGLPQPQQRLAPASQGDRRQVPVAEAVAELGGLAEGGVRGRGVALDKALDRQRQEHVPLLHAVQLAVVQQPPGPGQPAATAGQLAATPDARAPAGRPGRRPYPPGRRRWRAAQGPAGPPGRPIAGRRRPPTPTAQRTPGPEPVCHPWSWTLPAARARPARDTRTQVAQRTSAPYRLLEPAGRNPWQVAAPKRRVGRGRGAGPAPAA